MVYQWKTGARVNADAQVAGEMCKRLSEEGRLTAAELLEENRPEDAPLHGAFEWDDGVAAESWREHQARHIINSIVVVPERTPPVRGFFKLESTERTYHPIESIVSRVNTRQKLLDNALRELAAVQSKYKTLTELDRVWAALDEFKNFKK